MVSAEDGRMSDARPFPLMKGRRFADDEHDRYDDANIIKQDLEDTMVIVGMYWIKWNVWWQDGRKDAAIVGIVCPLSSH